MLATLLVVTLVNIWTLSTMSIIRTTGNLAQYSGTTGLRLGMNMTDWRQKQEVQDENPAVHVSVYISFHCISSVNISEAELTTNLLWTQLINYKTMLYRYSARRHQALVEVRSSPKSLPPPSWSTCLGRSSMMRQTGRTNVIQKSVFIQSGCDEVAWCSRESPGAVGDRAWHGWDGGTSLAVECGTNMIGWLGANTTFIRL